MRNYNFIRPLWIIAIAYLTRILVTNICLVLGSSKVAADNIGFLAMVIAAIVTFTMLNKKRRKFK
jgi:ABC-type cobalamin transport system permease subunit